MNTALGDAALRASCRCKCARRGGSAGALQPLPPSLPPFYCPSPARLPGAPAPQPCAGGTRRPAPGARSRLAPRAPAAPPLGSGALSQGRGGGSPLDPCGSLTRKLPGEWAPEDCPRILGNQGSAENPYEPACSPSPLCGLELGVGGEVLGRTLVSPSRKLSETRFRGGRPSSFVLLAKRG